MKKANKKYFNRIIPVLFLSLISSQAIAQMAPKAIEGGDGVYFTQSPRVSEKGKLGLKLTSYYHSEMVNKYNSNVMLMKVAASGAFGLTSKLELQGLVTTFAHYVSEFSSNKYQTGLGIGKIGLKYSLPDFKSFSISHAVKMSLETPGGALFVDAPGYPFDGKAYTLEALYLVSKPITYNLEGQFNIGYANEDLQGIWDLRNQLLASFSLKYRYNSRMFLLADVYTRTSLDANFDLFKDYLNVSLGAQYSLTPKLGLEVGFMRSLDNLKKTLTANYKENWQLLVGLNFSLDTFRPDYDNDGIDDRRDLDLDTPRGWAVDGTGVPLDSDRDGVPDAIDQEILSFRGAEVDAFGLAKDSDNDGVPDGIDVEENSDSDAIVDFMGRTIIPVDNRQSSMAKVSIISDRFTQKNLLVGLVKQPIFGIYFDFNSSEVVAGYIEQLDQIGEILEQNPEIQLEIIGFTDSVGTEEYNEKLSIKRAEVVKNYLAKKFKITIDRLPTTGYGEYTSLSMNPNYKAFPTALHRRVAFRVIDDGIIITGLPDLDANEEKRNSSLRVLIR
ncbi:OmpA family protein [candidate division KSB1 bacterium]|nr:OmpA family protein [candidate division KSB1 bacterium]